MTITPVAPAPLPSTGTGAASSDSADPAGGGLAGSFAGLLGTAPVTGDPAGSSDGSEDSAETGQPGSPGPSEDIGIGVLEILGAAQLMAAAQVVPVTPALPAALAAATGTPATVTDHVGTVPAVAAADSSLAAGAPTGSTAVSAGVPVTPSTSPSAVPLAAPATTEQPGVPTNQPASVPAAGSEPAGAPPMPGPDAVTAPGVTTSSQHETGRDHAGHRQGEPTAEPVAATSGAQPVTSTQAPPAAAARPDAPTTTQVTGQVFPEVTRLVSRGDGTQRITLTLSPEALGDVRVVLTVRDGDVHVRMVGSELAQQALRAGAPELHRLLDLAGAGSSQIVVGDDSSSSDAGTPSGTSDRYAAQHTEDHRTAGKRDGDATARDGYPGAQQPRRSTEPIAHSGAVTTSLSGVDVTI